MIPVNQQFHAEATGQVIEPRGACYISFTKELAGDRSFFVLDQSGLNGNDVLQGSTDDPIQNWDVYEYTDYADRVVSIELDREVKFPDSVQSALCDVVFDNHDGYFDPANTSSPIYEDNAVGRPLKLYLGYRNSGMIPQFVGMTEEAPTIDEKNKTATYHAIDFLYAISQSDLNNIIAMRDVRTDQVIAQILRQFGLSDDQYHLPQGSNVIPFLFFDAGSLAGDAFKQLMEAEYGLLWLDENGVIQFRPRSFTHPESQITIDPYAIIEVKPLGSSDLVNHIRITSDIREVQEFQEVYYKTDSSGTVSTSLWVVPANGSLEVAASLDDPCYSVVAPTQGKASSVSWFVAAKSDGTVIPGGVYASGNLSSNAYTLTFTNTNMFAVEIVEMRLWGEPAKIVDRVAYEASVPASVTRYGDQLLEINNNPFIQSINQAQTLGRFILSERSDFNSTLELTLKGDVSMQVGDAITLTGDYAGVYVIDSIKIQIKGGLLSTKLRLHRSEPNTEGAES